MQKDGSCETKYCKLIISGKMTLVFVWQNRTKTLTQLELCSSWKFSWRKPQRWKKDGLSQVAWLTRTAHARKFGQKISNVLKKCFWNLTGEMPYLSWEIMICIIIQIQEKKIRFRSIMIYLELLSSSQSTFEQVKYIEYVWCPWAD